MHAYLYCTLFVSMCYLPMPDKWPTGTCGLLPISVTPLPFLFPLFCLSAVLSAVLSSLATNLFHFTIILLFPQESELDFRNVGSMMECGLFSEALDTLRSAVFPGLLPPAPFLTSLLDYAQQVGPELQNLKRQCKTWCLSKWRKDSVNVPLCLFIV